MKSRAQLAKLDVMVHAKAKQMVVQATTRKGKSKAAASDDGNEYGLPGVLPPLNWFDPAGFTTDIGKDKLLFYREAEIKHGRICMSATLGFLVAEHYHPLYGGDLDVPSVFAGKDARLQAFWAALFFAAGIVESQSTGIADWQQGTLEDG